jgi:hypothetical protein
MLIGSMGAPKCLVQQGIEIFPKIYFGIVLIGLAPFSHRTTRDAKIAQCGKITANAVSCSPN